MVKNKKQGKNQIERKMNISLQLDDCSVFYSIYDILSKGKISYKP